ncbi:MAG: acetoacetate decarboxylase [Rickettsiales bacterium]|nr:acetoacetate decarboxylase [Rickettsiales bacterium]
MKKEDILNTASMPLCSPSYPKGPYRFIDREYFIITYESDPNIIREQLPEPLEPDGSNTVLYEFIKMPDSSGFGNYTESGVVIPCKYKAENMNFTLQMYLDDDPPIAGGREIWGFPKKFAKPKLITTEDTLTGTLEYAGERVAMGTMRYKQEQLIYNLNNKTICTSCVKTLAKKMSKTQVNLKLIPDVDGSPAIVQLVAYNLNDITIKGAWSGPARLHLIPHINAPVSDLPVKKIIGGMHFIADLTLPYGRILFDYLKK